MTPTPGGAPPVSAAFLLSQVGADAAREFAGRLGELDLTPPQAGLLRAVAAGPGRSQQALAQQLGTPPARLVALVDGLEQRDLLERRRNPDDRRLHAVHLGTAGEEILAALRRVAGEQDDAVLAVLDADERAQLHALLVRVAEGRGLAAGVHPGYRTLPAEATGPRAAGRGC